MNQLPINAFRVIWYASFSYFSYLMILITVQYIPIDLEVAFLNVKQEEIDFWHYRFAFFSHVYTSIFVLLAGSTQFSKALRTRYVSVHRNLGKLYIALVLFVASPSGLVMAFYANGGISSQVSFSLQAILWFYFTYQAYAFIRKKDWQKHQQFMMRSYALTMSAISLRLFKWIIASTLEWPPMDTYRVVSWLGWLVNIAIVECYLWYQVRLEKESVKH